MLRNTVTLESHRTPCLQRVQVPLTFTRSSCHWQLHPVSRVLDGFGYVLLIDSSDSRIWCVAIPGAGPAKVSKSLKAKSSKGTQPCCVQVEFKLWQNIEKTYVQCKSHMSQFVSDMSQLAPPCDHAVKARKISHTWCIWALPNSAEDHPLRSPGPKIGLGVELSSWKQICGNISWRWSLGAWIHHFQHALPVLTQSLQQTKKN